MTLVAVGLGVAAAATIAGSVLSSQAAAEGAEDAQATIQGGVNRLNAFRQQLREANTSYQDWQKTVTGQLVSDVTGRQQDSQLYKDSLRRFTAAQAGTGSIRSGAAQQGLRDLALAEEDAQFQRRYAVGNLLGTETARSEALQASTYNTEAGLLGGVADAQQQEANAKAAGIEGVAGGVSSLASGVAGAYGGGGAGLAGTVAAPARRPPGGGGSPGTPSTGAYVLNPSTTTNQQDLYGVLDEYGRPVY